MKRTLTCFGLFGLLAGALAWTTPAEGQIFRGKNAWAAPVTVAAPQMIPAPGTTTAAAESKSLGPVACAAVRMHLRQEYRKQGKSFGESVRLANQATDDVIQGLQSDAEKVAGKKFGTIGDGTIIQAILDFLKSPQGQALIKALVDMLIHLIGAQGPDVLHEGTVLTMNVPIPLYPDARDLIYTFSHDLAA